MKKDNKRRLFEVMEIVNSDFPHKLNEEIPNINEMAGTQYWTSTQKPKVMNVLNQIDAPNDWKKNVLKFERIATSVYNALRIRKVPRNSDIIQNHLSEMGRLLTEVGNSNTLYQSYGEERNHPNYQYWKQYCDLMNYVEDFDVSDILA